MRVLRRILGIPSEEGIRKVLQRLAKQGTVSSTRAGNAFSYQLNRDHLAAEHISGLARLQDELLTRLTDRLASWEIKPVFAAVFGSAASGSMTVDSDLDLLLVRPDGTDNDQWVLQVDELTADVTRWIGNDTRTLEYWVHEVAELERDPVLVDVATNGTVVHGSRTWLTRRLHGRKS